MIISKTPYRISFFGGGTDFPNWYNRFGGKVISTSINKYSYLVIRSLPEIFKYKFRIRYYYREEKNSKENIRHPVVRELLKINKDIKNIDITHHGDLPARSGIGSSSAFTVGLIHSLSILKKKNISKKDLANSAIFFEQNILKESVGSQDQVATSHGGFNSINFSNKGFNVKRCNNLNFIKKLESWCQIFYLGNQRSASSLEKKKFEYINKFKEKILLEMMQITNEAKNILLSKNKNNFIDFVKLLDDQWTLKKYLDKSISSNIIDQLYLHGKKHGAISGKILGAGGGGFFLFLTPPKFQKSLEEKIKLPKIKVKFEDKGSQIIMNSDD